MIRAADLYQSLILLGQKKQRLEAKFNALQNHPERLSSPPMIS